MTELRKTRLAIHYNNYVLGESKQPVCISCGSLTNIHYRDVPNLVCWSCDDAIQRHPFDENWLVRLKELLDGKFDEGPMEPIHKPRKVT